MNKIIYALFLIPVFPIILLISTEQVETEPETAKDCRFTYGKGTPEMFECLERIEGSQPTETIDSFEECIAAGNPAMESYPRQCRADGKHFVESIPGKNQCEIEGGLWGIWGNAESAPEECNVATSDAGVQCSDSSQCQSFCQAEENTEIDSDATGMCYGYELAICLQEVRNGMAQAEWCQ